jgi:hypothetical protein
MQSSTDRQARERPIAFAATRPDAQAGGIKTMRMPKLLACAFAIEKRRFRRFRPATEHAAFAAAARANQSRHFRSGEHRARLVYGACRRSLYRAGVERRHHQYERRQQRRRGIAGRPHRRDACRVVVGGPGQSGGRRFARHCLAVECDPLHVLFRAGRENRGRPERRRGRRQHVRLRDRFDSDARATKARPYPWRRGHQGIWRRHEAARRR